MKVTYNGLTITDEETTIQRVYELLTAELSNANVTFSTIEKAIQSSLCVSVYDGKDLVGFVRVISDYSAVSIILDAVIDPKYRSRGVGRKLFEFVHNHPRLRHTAKVLWTNNGEKFFTALGYVPLSGTLLSLK
ncbi:MAG: GNAT family N-acetyltransferase [Spirochaetaceae bacterium]|nr:GNAT family N-acetyltransferase [Spirochaetaceae bacterium]